MSKSEFVKDADGKVTHVRETTEDGTRSYLYEVDDSVTGVFLNDFKGQCVEVADHHPNGTTDAYEPDLGIVGTFLHDQKGTHK
jgi:hypothetical protein